MKINEENRRIEENAPDLLIQHKAQRDQQQAHLSKNSKHRAADSDLAKQYDNIMFEHGGQPGKKSN